MTTTTPAATVVVPTRDRPDHLAACLDALSRQEAVTLEVIVVDDASRDAAAVAAVTDLHDHVRLFRAGGDGPAKARNLGAAQARGEVVCFTDDDCRPGPRWVASLVARVGAGAAAVAGPTRNGRPDNPFSATSQLITNHLAEVSRTHGGAGAPFAPTSNLAVRRDVAARLPFDETYPLAAGEDREWCERLAASGDSLVHEPAAWVTHHQDLDARSFWRQQYRYGRGGHRLRVTGVSTYQPAGFYLGLLRAGAAAGPRVGALVLVAQAATAVGVRAEARAARP